MVTAKQGLLTSNVHSHLLDQHAWRRPNPLRLLLLQRRRAAAPLLLLQRRRPSPLLLRLLLKRWAAAPLLLRLRGWRPHPLRLERALCEVRWAANGVDAVRLWHGTLEACLRHHDCLRHHHDHRRPRDARGRGARAPIAAPPPSHSNDDSDKGDGQADDEADVNVTGALRRHDEPSRT